MSERDVGHFRRAYLPPTETFLYGLVSRTPGFRPHVMTEVVRNLDRFPIPCTYLLRHEEYRNIRHHAGPIGRLRHLARLNYPTCYERFVRDRDFGLLHAHFGPCGVAAQRLSRAVDRPLVVSFYGIDASSHLKRMGADYRSMFDRADRVLVLGSHMRKRLANAGCPEKKMREVRLGVDLDAIEFRVRTEPRGQRARILFCGRLVEKKGVEDVIRVAAVLAARGKAFDLRVVGDGPLRRTAQRMILEWGLGDRIQLLGAIDHGQVLREMARADLFLLPSRTARNGDQEGTPTVLLEAQAAGLPVVSTRHADIPETVCHEVTGLLAEPADVTGLAGCLQHLLEAPSTWARMGAAGRAHVDRRYNLRKQAETLGSVYKEIL